MREVGRCVSLFVAVLVASAGVVTCFCYALAFLVGIELGRVDLHLLGLAVLGALLVRYVVSLPEC